MRYVLASFVAAAALAAGGPVQAGEKAGITMPDTMQVAGKHLVLNGMGLREATVLDIDVYVAGLYLEQVSSDPGKILASSQVKRLVLRFKRDVSQGDIVDAWNEGFAQNSPRELATLKARIARLDNWMGDFSEGDLLTFTMIPGQGVQVHFGATLKGTIPGDDFSRAMLAIWLGPKPPREALKEGLLGHH